MEDSSIFDRINSMLEDTDYPLEIKDISDLEDFLNDEDNMRLEQFESIARMYDELMDGPDTDGYNE